MKEAIQAGDWVEGRRKEGGNYMSPALLGMADFSDPVPRLLIRAGWVVRQPFPRPQCTTGDGKRKHLHEESYSF